MTVSLSSKLFFKFVTYNHSRYNHITNISQWSCPTEIEIENIENSEHRNENISNETTISVLENDDKSDDDNNFKCQDSEKISEDQQYGKFEKDEMLQYQDKDNIYFDAIFAKSNIDKYKGLHSKKCSKNDRYYQNNYDNKNDRNDNNKNDIVIPTKYSRQLSNIEKNDSKNNSMKNIHDEISFNNESNVRVKIAIPLGKEIGIPLGEENTDRFCSELNSISDYYDKNNNYNLIEKESNCVPSFIDRKASTTSSSSSSFLCRRRSSRNINVILVLNNDDLGI